ncbi:phytoene desaturase family protein [Salinispira pacifica]|uniref:Phytoene dehydrogenase n=1 Tax=Salinispira pacifica TaxID=1307761 RepID=V5WI87_9SPIO|nr:phytoene desaturase family protein [Salinispira pacifica]AHC15274.1 Phytoene dehydrogenase [Salinispira pacifica]
MKKALVIGGGFAGMASAAKLKHQGMDVTLLERHDRLGGRGRSWEDQGYTFDMGPSWYLMPEVFEQFFDDLGKNRADYYSLKKLSPYYRVFFEDEGSVDIGPDRSGINAVFDGLEKKGSEKLEKYLKKASYKYKVAIEEFLYREYRSIFQFINPRLVFQGSRLGVFGDLHSHVKKYFKDHRAQKILEYAMVFLGNSPSNAPALYSIMSHVDLVQGVYFPHGGMNKMVEGMHRLLEDMGVDIRLNTDVTRIIHADGRATGVETDAGTFKADVVLATGDYHHIEQKLLDQEVRNYSAKYWEKAVVAPSMFIMYLGVGKKLPGLKHHNLFFAREWNTHFDEIFKNPAWPDNPSYYVSVTSDDDDSMSPEGKENVFVLVPVAPGLSADRDFRKEYGDKIIRHLENLCGENIRDSIEVQRYYSGEDFTEDYGALKGTALGLAHTLGQTAVFRPSMRNKHLKNVFYAGQYTHPGVGVPMTLIAADIVSSAIGKEISG